MLLHQNLLSFLILRRFVGFCWFFVFFLFVLLRDSVEEHLSIFLVTLSDEPVTAALQLLLQLLSGETSNKILEEWHCVPKITFT